MAIQIAAALMPIIKKMGTEIAAEVAYKIASEEFQRQKLKLRNKVDALSAEDSKSGGRTRGVKLMSMRIASEAIESKALKTGLGAVLGSMTAATSASANKYEAGDVFEKNRKKTASEDKINKESRKIVHDEKIDTSRRKYGR